MKTIFKLTLVLMVVVFASCRNLTNLNVDPNTISQVAVDRRPHEFLKFTDRPKLIVQFDRTDFDNLMILHINLAGFPTSRFQVENDKVHFMASLNPITPLFLIA